MKKDTLGRRGFFRKTTVAALGFIIIPRNVIGGRGYTAPSDQLATGKIMGREHFEYEDTKFLSPCDFDKTHPDQEESVPRMWN